MQISPQLESILQLAGNMVARRCVTLLQGRTVGIDLGAFGEDESKAITQHDPRDPLAPAQLGRHMGAAPWPGVLAHVLVRARPLEMDGTPFADALVAEFADASGRIDGLVIAIPYRAVLGPRALKMHSVRVVACPPVLQPLSDDLVVAFARGIASFGEGFAAWMQALEIEPGVEPRPPASARDPLFWAAAITPDDPHRDSNAKVRAHIEAFLGEGQFEGGLAFEKLLRGVTLDFSLASLTALDALLERLHTERQPQRDALLDVQAGRNFVHLLGAYLGETLALAACTGAHWHTTRQRERLWPDRPALAQDARLPLVCSYDDLRSGAWPLLPCDLVARRLFGEPGARPLDEAGAVAVAAIRAAHNDALGDPGAHWNAVHDHGRLQVAAPAWFVNDPEFTRWFAALPTLWRSGRVVWANLVQANKQLFRPGPDDHPGEVVYDPTGRVDPQHFARGASAMYGLKGLRLRNPLRMFLAQALTHERVRTSGIEIPATLGARGLRTASVLFFRAHLPGGVLTETLLPILVSDQVPGAVMVLPARYWTHLA